MAGACIWHALFAGIGLSSEYFDVVIVGAGLSGIGTAVHLRRHCPDKSFILLEGREASGGTWDLFRYPGIRSDSDMYTLGYSFKPWKEGKAIADGPSILNYIRETATENAIDDHIRFQHQVLEADWSSTDVSWNLKTRNGATGETVTIRCNMLLMCSGYYSYEAGHTPHFPGLDSFSGQVVHPQQWPEGLDYSGKDIVVIGSGATAMTLVPELAKKASLVTLLQRSPTYVVARPDTDIIARILGALLPDQWAYKLVRWKNITMQQWLYGRTRTHPDRVKKKLLKWARKSLPKGYDIDRHFTPRYNPWDQRLCLIPNGDLFQAISANRACVVTDEIETFHEQGIQLKSGKSLPADLVVTATGLELVVLGEVAFSVDGAPVDFARTFTYKGMMFSGVPNMISTFGYINASWTLRADLTAEYACRVINHMDSTNLRQCTPRLTEDDRTMPERPWIDDFSSGYMQRMMHRMPRQGDRAPWVNPQNFKHDKKMISESAIDDGALEFSQPAEPEPENKVAA